MSLKPDNELRIAEKGPLFSANEGQPVTHEESVVGCAANSHSRGAGRMQIAAAHAATSATLDDRFGSLQPDKRFSAH